MNRYAVAVVIGLVGFAIFEGVFGVPVETEKAAVQEGDQAERSKEDLTKGQFALPSFLMAARPGGGWGGPGSVPGPPVAFGNATTQGDVQGLFAHNENSLFVVSGPNQNAIANLSSTAAYFATPINETQSTIDGNDSVSHNMAGFTVTAQEDTHAYAEGEYIQFVNHGASYATGWGDSAANGTTLNPGPEPAPAPSGSGWKGPNNKPREE